MSKDIKDYLHLYLGCEIKHDTGKYFGTLLSIGFYTANIHCDYFKQKNGHRVPKGKDFGYFDIMIERLKPILRPLSDMTEKEREYLNDIELGESSWPTVAYALAPCFAWLLSKQFDLFGLIESGLAIDKKTLP